MNLIFCLSYLNVPQVLTILDRIGTAKSLIVVHNEKVEAFFSRYLPEVEILNVHSPTPFVSKRILSRILTILYLKYNLKKKLNSYKFDSVYFGFKSWCYFETWIVQFLSDKATIYYYNSVPLGNNSRILTFKDRLNSSILKWLYGDHFIYENTTGKAIFSLSNYFLEKNKIQLVEIERTSKLGLKVLTKSRVKPGEVLILLGATSKAGLIDQKEYQEILDDLFKKLNSFSISIKEHPRFTGLVQLPNDLEYIDPLIPANVFLDYFNIIIGFETGALYEAAQLGKKSISFLAFLPESKERSFYVEYLKDNLLDNAHIAFPETWDDFSNEISKHISS